MYCLLQLTGRFIYWDSFFAQWPLQTCDTVDSIVCFLFTQLLLLDHSSVDLLFVRVKLSREESLLSFPFSRIWGQRVSVIVVRDWKRCIEMLMPLEEWRKSNLLCRVFLCDTREQREKKSQRRGRKREREKEVKERKKKFPRCKFAEKEEEKKSTGKK